jgi:filamentous hemagglutinin family protein
MIRCSHLFLYSLSSLLLGTILARAVQAQVISDTTLNAESSIVNIDNGNGVSTYTITGGAARGSNLFHSFEQFSVMAGDIALFANSDTVETIVGRVTGNSLSNLNGVIRANGNANLFLLNPAGILIGPNARLDIGGAFLASTGQGLRFENDFIYDLQASEIPPLLTVSAPIGLFMGNDPSGIEVVGQTGIASQNFAVAPGQSLTLVGEILLSQQRD